MQLRLPGAPHLTYCTNIHAGESWPQVRASLADYLPYVKRRICPDRDLAVGLRLSARAAYALKAPDTLEEFKRFLDEGNFYVLTVNAFPFGDFHGVRVKEAVYAPDWRTPERLHYTTLVADILADLAPVGLETSISTVPGAFRTDVAGTACIDAIVDGLVRCAAHLYELTATKGRSIVLAIEPEPACFLETTQELIDFFEAHLLAPPARQLFARLTGVSPHMAERLLRQHVGICYDVCHSAVAFENPEDVLGKLLDAGIRVAKIQLSSALKLPRVNAESAVSLRMFDDGVYLHQTVQTDQGRIVRFTDLPDALAALEQGDAAGEWRVHCHVPLFADCSAPLHSTREELRSVLDLCRRRAVAAHLEVETYTWNVLPSPLRGQSLADDIVRELAWVRQELAA